MKKYTNVIKEKIKTIKLKSLIMNLYAICLFLLPIIPDVGRYAEDSRKWWLFNGLTIIVAIILLVINIIEKKFKLNKWDGLLIIYLALVIISTIVSRFDILTLVTGRLGRGEGTLTILSYVTTFIIFSKGYKELKWIVKLGIVVACVVSIYSLIQVFIPEGVELPAGMRAMRERATGTMRNPNFLSSYICLFLPMATFWYINKPKVFKFLAIGLIFCGLLTALTLSGYLTSFAVIILSFIGSVIFSNQKIKVIRNFTLVILIFVLIFALLDNLKGGIYTKELFGKTDEPNKTVLSQNESGGARLFIWKKTIKVMYNYKWFGVGPDALFKEINNVDKYGDNKPLFYKKIDKAHSEPLQIGATTGLPSMVTYLVIVITLSLELFISLIKRLIKNKENLSNTNMITDSMIFISIVSYFTQSLVNISVIHVAPIYWAMLGLGAGSLIADNNKKHSN